jgi:predicted aspartyl protease
VLASVDLGALRVEGVAALILERLEGADGLLGLSVLDRFHFEVRQEDGYVALRRR